MLVVLGYDIGDDRRRARVGRLLEGAGVRSLESGFECDLTPAQWEKLRRRLLKLLNEKEDKARVYFLCETCVRRTLIIGGGAVERSQDTYIV